MSCDKIEKSKDGSVVRMKFPFVAIKTEKGASLEKGKLQTLI